MWSCTGTLIWMMFQNFHLQLQPMTIFSHPIVWLGDYYNRWPTRLHSQPGQFYFCIKLYKTTSLIFLTHANLTYVRINIKLNPTGKVPQPKTRERYRTEKMEKKQHKAKYLTGKVPQAETTEKLQAEKIEKKQHKAKYLTGKVPQRKQQKNCKQRRSKRNRTGSIISKAMFHNRR